MELFRKYLFTVIFILVFSGLNYAQVTLTLPTSSGQLNAEIIVPVTVNNITSLQLKSFQFQINFNSEVIEILDATTSGTISSAASATKATITPGKYRIAWASSDAIVGSGTLINLKIKIKGTGSSPLTYVVSDGNFVSEFASLTTVYTVTANNGLIALSTINHAPTLSLNPVGPYSLNTGETLQITLSGSDEDLGDQVTFSYSSTPTMVGAEINPTTGAFSWSTTASNVGVYNVTFRSTDTKVNTELTSTITVIGPNVPPTLNLNPAGPEYNINEGSALTINLVGEDINPGDQTLLVYSVLNKPEGATLTGSVFAWTPTAAQGRTDPYYMTFKVTDPSGLFASVIATITVNNLNHAPTFTAELMQGYVVDVHTAPNPVYYTFQYEANDLDGDPLFYGLVSGPTGAGITTNGLFSWAPTASQAGQSFVVQVLVSDGTLSATSTRMISASTTITDVFDERNLSKEFRLFQNYPNPFNPSTVIGFSLPKESSVQLKVYNLLGQEISTLLNKRMSAGYHSVTFDAADLISGVYLYKLEAENHSSVQKMIFQK